MTIQENTNEKIENTRAQMRKGILEYCVLLAISKKPMYSSDALQALKKADVIVVEGTLYPLLNRMRRNGLLEHEWQESEGGPPRKYYSLTPEGKRILKELSGTWSTLAQSIKSLTKESLTKKS